MFFERDSDLLRKKSAEIFTAQSEVIGNFLQGDRLVVVFADIGDDFTDTALILEGSGRSLL